MKEDAGGYEGKTKLIESLRPQIIALVESRGLKVKEIESAFTCFWLTLIEPELEINVPYHNSMEYLEEQLKILIDTKQVLN